MTKPMTRKELFFHYLILWLASVGLIDVVCRILEAIMNKYGVN